MQGTYAALNGAEIRRITKANLESEIDKLKYLSMGNSFHRAHIEFGFTMSAYPADVPVPEREFSFEIDAATADSTEAIKQFTKVEELDKQIGKLQEQKNSIETLIFEASEVRESLVKESEISVSVNAGDKPDIVRIDNNLDVPVVETKGGKTVETTAPASLFKKAS